MRYTLHVDLDAEPGLGLERLWWLLLNTDCAYWARGEDEDGKALEK